MNNEKTNYIEILAHKYIARNSYSCLLACILTGTWYTVENCIFFFVLTSNRGSETPLCDELDSYLICLHTALPNLPPVGTVYINNIVTSLTLLIRECQSLRQEVELQTCHSCDWSRNEEECDRQPSQRCQPNQVRML